MQDNSFDIVIVGGGMVGMSLACALRDTGLQIAMIERFAPHASAENPILDARTTGLARSSERLFSEYGLWSEIKSYVSPIRRLHISNQGGWGFARVNGKLNHIDPIGYMLPNHYLLGVLSRRVAQQENLYRIHSATIDQFEKTSDGYQLHISQNDESFNCHARLLIGADGANSAVRDALGIKAEHRDYQQTAIITNVRTEKPHGQVAYERFTQHGPLAVLPIQDDHCALIWTHASDEVKQYLDMPDVQFLSALQGAFGFRLGNFLQVGKRVAYPLTRVFSEKLTDKDALLLGNAGQSLHPVAAQGFNLGLRDVRAFVALLQRYAFDLDRASELLTDYEQQRAPDRHKIMRLTEGLNRVFSAQTLPVKFMRNVGLTMLGNVPPLQREFLRHNMGMQYFFEWGESSSD